MSGSKNLKLLLIGKLKSLHCFKGIKLIDVDYEHNIKTMFYNQWTKQSYKVLSSITEKRIVIKVLAHVKEEPPTPVTTWRN